MAILVLADVSCAESSHAFHDAEVVAAVAVNRAHARSKPITHVVRRGQFARGCLRSKRTKRRFHVRHIIIAAKALAGQADVPAWFDRNVLFFCAETGKPTSGCARWRQKGSWARTRLRSAGNTRYGGRVFHRYFRDRRLGDG